MSLAQRLVSIFRSDLRALRFTTSILSFMMGLGFIISSVENENYDHLIHAASKQAWAILFILNGIGLLLGALCQLPFWAKNMIGAFGIWCWTYIFLSFAVFDPTPIRSTEWMLAIPILVEFWLIAEAPCKKSPNSVDNCR